LCLAFILTLLTACTADPFTRPPLPPLASPDPANIRTHFASLIPNAFTSDETVIIQAPFRPDMAVLGVLRLDRSAGTFELVGLSPMGLKFFDLAGDAHNTEIRFAAEPLQKQTEVLNSIAQDIRRIYFDLLPAESATAKSDSTTLTFSQKTPAGTLIYQFGGDPTLLLEKRLDTTFSTAWRVQYFDYTTSPLYPRGIVMDNGQYHYRIIIKNRQWVAK
jgi:hypothetical protein